MLFLTKSIAQLMLIFNTFRGMCYRVLSWVIDGSNAGEFRRVYFLLGWERIVNILFKVFAGFFREQAVKQLELRHNHIGHQNKAWGKGRAYMGMLRIWLCALLLVFISSQAFAYDVVDAGGTALPEPVKTITTQATEFISGDSLAVRTSGSPAFAVGDTIEISLSGGATFADGTYILESSIGGAGTGDLTNAVLQTASPAGKSTIKFLMRESTIPGWGFALSAIEIFILSGDAIAGQRTNVNLPQVDGRDIYITFTVRDTGSTLKGSVQHLTFDNTLPPAPAAQGATEAQSKSAIQNVLSTHARNITAHGAGLSGLLTGNGFGSSNATSLFGEYESIGNALAAATDFSRFSLPFSLEMLDGHGNFAANLNQIRAWDPSLGIGDEKSSRKPPSQLAETDSPFNVWIKGRWQGTTDIRGGTKGEGDFGLLMAGADYRYSENTLIGLLAQFDLYNQTATGQSSEGKGHGWMFGPYLVFRLDDNLIWDARIAWGRSKNEINPLGLGWDDFEGERWQVETNLTGDMQYKGWKIFPQLGMNYFEEEQKAYTSINGTGVGSQTVAVGNLSFGPEVSRSWEQFEDTVLRLFGAFRGIWDFKSPDIAHSDGSSINTEQVRARGELGGDVTFKNGGSVYAKYTFDGIGIAGYEAHSLELVASTPVHFWFLSDGSNLKSSFSQSVSEINTNQFMLSLEVPLN